MGLGGREREIVSTLVETKAVDFEAIGKVLAEFGPAMALDMDYENGFCGTMRGFARLHRPVFGGGAEYQATPSGRQRRDPGLRSPGSTAATTRPGRTTPPPRGGGWHV